MPGLACQSDDGKNAVFTGTFLETGITVTLCEDDLINFCAKMTEEMTGAPVIDFLAAYVPDAAPDTNSEELTDEQLFAQAWIEAHRSEIEAKLTEGFDFEEALDLVAKEELLATEITDSSSPEAN